jgi:hypothetical protein
MANNITLPDVVAAELRRAAREALDGLGAAAAPNGPLDRTDRGRRRLRRWCCRHCIRRDQCPKAGPSLGPQAEFPTIKAARAWAEEYGTTADSCVIMDRSGGQLWTLTARDDSITAPIRNRATNERLAILGSKAVSTNPSDRIGVFRLSSGRQNPSQDR